MGLDMYLHRKTYIGAMYDHNNVTGTVEIFVDGEKLPIDFKKISRVEEEIGYWRKANAIHKWFFENVQNGVDDCGDYYVTNDNLQDLLEKVNKVLADHSLAKELLPSESGFFFGNTEYDEWYFNKLEDTKAIIEDAINGGGDIYYHSSW